MLKFKFFKEGASYGYKRLVGSLYWRPWNSYETRAFKETVNPLWQLANLEWEVDEGDLEKGIATPTRRARVAYWIMCRVRIAGAIGRCLFMRSDDYEGLTWWESVLYRAKAIVCLLLGRTRDSYWNNSFELLTWNWRRVSHEYEEYDSDCLEVGLGWRDWRVRLRSIGLY